MKYRLLGVILMLMLITLPAAAFADDNAALKQISKNGITVSYPAGLETQAQKVLEIANSSIAPSIEIHKQAADFLKNSDAIAADISNLFGAEEIKESSRLRLLVYKMRSDILVKAFSNIRLVPYADVAAKGELDAGAVQVKYDKTSDDFMMAVASGNISKDAFENSFYPVFFNADGAIRSQDKIANMAISFLGSNKAIIISPVHETIHHIICDDMKLFYPFTRWFNEGVGGWATKRVVIKNEPALTALAEEIFSVSPGSKQLRDKINLPAWPQSAFQDRRASYFEPAMEAAQTQYSVEIISNLLGGNRDDQLGKIITHLKYGANVDNDKICEAINKTTGIDFKKKLMEYVPKEIRSGINSGAVKKLSSQAEKLATEKKFYEAESKISEALQMAPEDINLRLNLAWIKRETNEKANSEIQIFIAARLLRQQEYSIHLFASSFEANYVLGRLAMLVGNVDAAKSLLEPIVKAKPDHADAKRAIEQIKALEATAKSGQK